MRTARMIACLCAATATLLHAQPSSLSTEGELPTLAEVRAAKADLWGEAALRKPGGPTFEFFKDLLPPLRYVHADFRDYPIVLGAPNNRTKGRLISNGSGVNLEGKSRSWYEVGTAVTFRVGNDEFLYGGFPFRLDGPRFAEGYLPIVQLRYDHAECSYAQETFASADPLYADHVVVLARFSLRVGDRGRMVVRPETEGALKAGDGFLQNANGEIVLWFDSHWNWEPGRRLLVAQFTPKVSPAVAIATKPMPAGTQSPLLSGGYDHQRKQCAETWDKLLGGGMRVEVAERLVNDAWRSSLAAIYTLVNGDRMHYSAGNQYDKLYQAEGCDAVEALLNWGFGHDAQRLILSQLEFTRKGLEYHQAGHKLQLLTEYFQLTRNADFIIETRPLWEKEVALIVRDRTNEHGLFPREQYCGDIKTPVYSLNSNAKCWRALRDFAVVLGDIGEKSEAARLAQVAKKFREDIIAATAKSERRDVSPPFIPIALLGEEEPYSPITGVKIGSYWNLMINYVLGSGVFGLNSEREDWMIDYVRQHGGLCMGLTRSRPSPSFWTGYESINPLYGMRYVQTILRRDEPDRALVSFYGMLAQGMTRNTFVCGEGASLQPVDDYGRLFYCPPNSAGNAFFLAMLRDMLVQDQDLDDNGTPETLRLLFATPRGWLFNGNTITVEDAPTAFGNVSVRVQSHLNDGEVIADVQAPERAPEKMLLRVRLPSGWRVVSAKAGDKSLKVDDNATADLTGLTGEVKVRFAVKKED